MKTKEEILTILSDNDKMELYLHNRSKLYTSYSVKNKDGKFKSVIDIKTVIEILKEILNN